jgi:cytochrome c oxidase subunit 1
MAAQDYLNARRGPLSWLMTIDHKRIALLYLGGMTLFFLFGVVMAVAFRLELIAPGVQFFGAEMYNRLLTLHGVAMIFLVIIPGSR